MVVLAFVTNVPADTEKILAIPITAFAFRVKEVPLMVALYKFGEPAIFEVPVKVVVPALAEKVPVAVKVASIVKLELVLTDAPDKMLNPLKLIVPAPVINHSDSELELIESLVGRSTPFGRGGYELKKYDK